MTKYPIIVVEAHQNFGKIILITEAESIAHGTYIRDEDGPKLFPIGKIAICWEDSRIVVTTTLTNNAYLCGE